MGQLLTPMEKEEEETGTAAAGGAEQQQQLDFGSSQSRVMRATFVQKNIAYMHQKNVGDALINLCATKLPKVAAYVEQWNSITSTGEGKEESRRTRVRDTGRRGRARGLHQRLP